MKHEEITEKIISVFYKVYNTLGSGFLEKVYENAMKVEFDKIGIHCQKQCPIKVLYSEIIVGDYIADFIIEDKIVVEIKAKKELCQEDETQLLNYLAGTKKEIGLLFNFGTEPKFERRIRYT